jgi:hypothetical protein
MNPVPPPAPPSFPHLHATFNVEARGYFVTGRFAPNRPLIKVGAILLFHKYKYNEEPAIGVHESDDYCDASIGAELADGFTTVLAELWDHVTLVGKAMTVNLTVFRGPIFIKVFIFSKDEADDTDHTTGNIIYGMVWYGTMVVDLKKTRYLSNTIQVTHSLENPGSVFPCGNTGVLDTPFQET